MTRTKQKALPQGEDKYNLALGPEALLGLRVCAFLAYNGPTKGPAIHEWLGLKGRYIEPLLQHMAHVGLIQGIRGPRGGYRLDVHLSTSVSYIVASMNRRGTMGTRTEWDIFPTLQAKLIRALNTTSLKDIAEDTVGQDMI